MVYADFSRRRPEVELSREPELRIPADDAAHDGLETWFGRTPLLQELIYQIQTIRFVLIAVLLVTLTAGFSLTYLQTQTAIDALDLIVDPSYVGELPAYTGLYSSLGILAWCVSATACMLCGALLRDERTTTPLVRYLMSFGIFTAILCLDDLFLVHEEGRMFLADLFNFSQTSKAPLVFEAVIFLGYVAIGGYIGLTYWSVIRKTEVLLLGAAVASLGSSMVVDVGMFVIPSNILHSSIGDVMEELMKFNGILLWMAYAVRLSNQSIRSRMSETNAE